MPALQKKHKKSSAHNIKSVMNTRYGPSDRIRTCGILLPKQARYQLRYTRICTFQRGSMRLHTFKRERRFLPHPFSAIALSGRVRFQTAQAASLYILQFA